MTARIVDRPEMPDFSGALCAQVDPELWFPGSGDSTEAPRMICARCPVQEACLDYGLSYTVEGVWGGLGVKPRQQLASLQGRRRAPVMASEFLPYVVDNSDRDNDDMDEAV